MQETSGEHPHEKCETTSYIIKLLSTNLSHTPKRMKKEEEMSGSMRSEDISSMVKMNRVLFFQM